MDFPFADAPGIIRANQKDEYITSKLHLKLRDVIQSIKGVRFVHYHAVKIQTLATLLYLGLTTLSKSRTLGEEYTDLFYVTNKRRLPSQFRLALYVITSGLSPLIIPKLAAKIKEIARKIFKQDEDEDEDESSWIEEYLTPTSLVSLNLMLFYFSGAYYQISKRIFGLRYIFGYRVDPLTQPKRNYELIGVLMAARALFKLAQQIKRTIPLQESQEEDEPEDIKEMGQSLESPEVLSFIKGSSRNCHLCYEEMRAPTLTLCGHIFCWSCISDWCRGQKVCPLCRQECHEQHLLALRT